MLKKFLSIFFFLLVSSVYAQLQSFSGKVSGMQTDELLIDAKITITAVSNRYSATASTGLTGTFRFDVIPAQTYHVVITMDGYQDHKETIAILGNVSKVFKLSATTRSIDQVEVQRLSAGTDAEARRLERLSPNVINIISARQIELSPDITVANVVQRVSGLSIERNANGDPQYAVVRGMNKRYNNTLVNGIKIPSPDNDNRFVPLDIFPAVFLEKLTVSKSLSADMEADAIGGTIDMIMKNVPASRRLLDFDFQIGGNFMSQDGNFTTYDRSGVYKFSPAEYLPIGREATASDLSNTMFTPIQLSVLPDILTSVSYGERFFNKKLGVLLGASYQNSYRPSESYQFNPQPNVALGNRLNMNEYINRRTSTQQQRAAFHGKLDYNLASGHNIALYSGQYLLNEFRVREQYNRELFTSTDNFPIYPTTRVTNTYQTISIVDLSGDHQISDQLKIDWHAVYSLAQNELPDDGVFMRSATLTNNQYVNERPYFQDSPNTRAWERNADEDISFFLNASYNTPNIDYLDLVKVGGLFRNKTRDNFYRYYRYQSIPFDGIRGVDWEVFDDLPWDGFTNGFGDGNASSLVYDADERITAGYINTQWVVNKLAIQAGLRAEHTNQGYQINQTAATANATALSQKQSYLNFFPSVSLKYALDDETFLKSTYYKAISRPGFFEIVPTRRNRGGGDSFFHEEGNSELRPTVAHNFDVRYEYFPTVLDQILVGAFYKRLLDPIEYGFVPRFNATTGAPQASSVIAPQNYGTANNFGLEVDYTRYFRKVGVRLNYTYTNSNIIATKLVGSQVQGAPNEYVLVDENRALQGQSDHIGNVALLYKDLMRQWDAQLVLNYTGRRLAFVSPFEGADHFMSPMAVMDLSIEKGFGRYVVFVKGNNLLDTPYRLTIGRGLAVPEGPYPHQENPEEMANVRLDRYGIAFRLGFRFKL
ncbi:TonB-dependent receptor [Sphingobacterium sp. lm-10]|uniref:TonB-dependent receptor n=1 Tax=Sphingobacterium sp. lm-10 TaxID=2944904 RepID=UPI002020D52C|nr:TonB-dependent receptor [Sphingobacterium sp. lm-10]MCL7988823.1 TonB-dependent receptor [Sphingobacterium sp. lm-10]